MNTRRNVLLGILAVLVAVWVSSAPAPPQPASVPAWSQAAPLSTTAASARRGHRRTSTASTDTDPATFDLAEATLRLRTRLASAPRPRSPQRNPFIFEQVAPKPAPATSAKARGAAEAPAPALPPPAPALVLSGIAETKDGDRLVRTAIISGAGQLYFAKVGERVAGRFEVIAIGADAVELRDLEAVPDASSQADAPAPTMRLGLR